MNHDAEFFNENQQAMKEQYSASAIPEEKRKPTPTSSTPTQQDNEHSTFPDKHEHASFSNGRFVMSSFELYETKTVRIRKRGMPKDT